MPLVYISPLKKTYSSNLLSLSTILGIILLVIAILLPLFAAYATEDFWLRLKEYTEQPLVKYYGHYMVYRTKIDNSDNIKTYFTSSHNQLNDKFDEICKSDKNCFKEQNSQLLSISSDLDGDGINDKLTLKYEIDEGVAQDEKMDIKIMFFLEYGLMKKVKMIMTPMVFVDIPITRQGGRKINLNGNIELVQKSPIPRTTITSKIYYEDNPFEIQYNQSSPYDLLYYYNRYINNNYTVKYNYEKIDQRGEDNKIQIVMEMNIPKLQKVFYIESVYESIKYAWMQYFYIFLPIFIILYLVFQFIIKNNIFYSQVKSDL